MKSDYTLLSSLCLACQATDGDVDQLFGHENHACTQSGSQGGNLWLGSKAYRLVFLEVETSASPLVDARFLDGAVVVQMLNPGTDKTILEYALQVFLSYYASA